MPDQVPATPKGWSEVPPPPADWSEIDAAPSTPAPAAKISRKQIDEYKLRFFNTNNPKANIPMETAFNLSHDPNHPVSRPAFEKMSPVGRAAITEKIGEFQRDYQYARDFLAGKADASHGFAPPSVPRDAMSIAAAVEGPEGARQLESAPGFVPAAKRFGYSMTNPANAMQAGAAMESKLITAGFSALQAKSAVEHLQRGDKGGAAFELLLGGLAPAVHAVRSRVGLKDLIAREIKPEGEANATLPQERVDGSTAEDVRPGSGGETSTGRGRGKGKGVQGTPPAGEGGTPDGAQGPADADAAAQAGGTGTHGQEPGLKSKSEKISQRTGLTPSQEDFLTEKLKDVATEKAVTNEWRTQPETIKVPRDGQFTVTGEQAAHLHKSLTGEDIAGLEHVTKKTKKFTGSLGSRPQHLKGTLSTRPNPLGSEPGLTLEERGVQPVSEPASGTLQSTVIPGAQEFVEQDVEPALQTLKEAPEKIKGALTELFNPPGVAKSAEVTAQHLRAGLGEMAHSEEQARSTLKATRNFFSKSLIKAGGAPKTGDVLATDHPALQFVRAVEAGQKLPTELEHLQPMADWMRNSLDNTWKRVRELGIADGFIEDYWPHLWQKPGKVSNYLRQITGRRPFAGPESFKHQRTIPTFDEGLARGLEPITWNPVEQFMLKLHEMNRSIVAHDTWNFLKDEKIAQFVRFGQDVPEGYVKVNDKIAKAIELRPTTKVSGEPGAPEAILRGEWYLPEPAGRIINNYLSPGLRGNYLYDAMQGIGNTLNQAQLGLSAFHLAFVGHDAAVSHTALGIQNILEGRVKTGVKNLALGVSQTAIPKSLVRGSKIAKAYRSPEPIDPNTPIGRTVKLLEQAGARVNQAPEYTNKSVDSLRNALERHNYPGAALRLVPAMFEVAAKPVMEFAVPRLKLGVAEEMLNAEVERLGPNASESDLTAAAQKVWDSVDNRMGQLVYDNLFWNNYLKQGGQLAQRSLGWNLGSVRELGGGAKDIATAPWRLKSGDRLITHRVAYAAALPLQTALVGSMLYYLYNGKPAPTLKDALQPKVGKERWQIASYMRDVTPLVGAAKEGVPGISHEVRKRVVSKLNPVFASTNEFLSNEDYWGNPIYGDSKKAIGATNWLINQFTPFSFRDPGRKSTKAEKTRQFFGFTRVPKERTLKEQERAEGMRLLKAASKK